MVIACLRANLLAQSCPTNPQEIGPNQYSVDAVPLEKQVALLTIYDMCKAVDRGMTITDVRLLEKHGGKSGSYVKEE